MESDIVDLAMEHVLFDGSVYDVDCSPCLDGFASSDTQVSGGQDTEKDTKSTSIAMAGETARVRNVTIEKLRAKLQIPPEGHFDRTDIVWEERTNQGRGRSRDTHSAIIPWDRLGDFVAGEQSMRDFPCTFNEVPSLGHKEGTAENAKEGSFLQKIK